MSPHAPKCEKNACMLVWNGCKKTWNQSTWTLNCMHWDKSGHDKTQIGFKILCTVQSWVVWLSVQK